MKRLALGLAACLLAGALASCGPVDNLTRLNFGRTAIVTGDFDTVEQLIQEVANTGTVQAELQLYDGYVDGPHFETDVSAQPGDLALQVEDLLRADTTSGLDQFDTAFLSCGMRGVSDHVYNGVAEDDHLVNDATVTANLADAVDHGIALYFSDWTYDFVRVIWPDQVQWVGDADLDTAQRGVAGPVNARVVDQELATYMEVAVGDEIEVVFNQGGWAVPLSVSSEVEILVEADIEYDDPDSGEIETLSNVPLVFSFSSGAGRVVYTAFHNEAQITDDARDVLRFAFSVLSGS